MLNEHRHRWLEHSEGDFEFTVKHKRLPEKHSPTLGDDLGVWFGVRCAGRWVLQASGILSSMGPRTHLGVSVYDANVSDPEIVAAYGAPFVAANAGPIRPLAHFSGQARRILARGPEYDFRAGAYILTQSVFFEHPTRAGQEFVSQQSIIELARPDVRQWLRRMHGDKEQS